MKHTTSSENHMLFTLVSRVFDPWNVLSVVVVVAAYRSMGVGTTLVRFLLIYFLCMVTPPIFLLERLIKQKKITSLDVSNRKQRVKVLSGFLGFLIIDCFLIALFGNNELIRLFILFFAWFLGFYIITLKWKVSGHTGILMLSLGLLYLWYGKVTLPLFLLLPLVAWVRVKRHNHTASQVIGGVVYSLIILFLKQLFSF